MAAITSANVANAIVKLVAADALPLLMGNLIMGVRLVTHHHSHPEVALIVSLAQQFTVDILYGCGILPNMSGRPRQRV